MSVNMRQGRVTSDDVKRIYDLFISLVKYIIFDNDCLHFLFRNKIMKTNLHLVTRFVWPQIKSNSVLGEFVHQAN